MSSLANSSILERYKKKKEQCSYKTYCVLISRYVSGYTILDETSHKITWKHIVSNVALMVSLSNHTRVTSSAVLHHVGIAFTF